jgi:hypothetical protein
MKHAGAETLEALSDLLQSLRTRTALVERRPGIFYVKGKAYLHFHEDPAGLFADLRLGGDWQRFPVNSAGECAELLAVIDGTQFGEKAIRSEWPPGQRSSGRTKRSGHRNRHQSGADRGCD